MTMRSTELNEFKCKKAILIKRANIINEFFLQKRVAKQFGRFQ